MFIMFIDLGGKGRFMSLCKEICLALFILYVSLFIGRGKYQEARGERQSGDGNRT